MIMGDLNSHISCNDHDFIPNESDDNLSDFLPGNYDVDNIHCFRNTELQQVTNAYGRNILDLCIACQLRILNCRTIGDSRGKMTYHGYNGSSVFAVRTSLVVLVVFVLIILMLIFLIIVQ